MKDQISVSLPDRLSRLKELAYNMWFSWTDDALKLFRAVDPDKWEQVYHNPVRLLQETPAETFEQLANDETFLELYRRVIARWEDYKSRETWFSRKYPEHRDKIIAYFSAEFGFHESLPIYSGGLGVLAGDHCKSASDLGLPFVAIGLMYKRGYFNQKFDSYGNQIAEQVNYDFDKLPIKPALIGNEELYVSVSLPGRSVRLKVWTVSVGTVSLYLLDADIEGNSPEDRGLTGQLYGGNQDTRIQQEIILGIGGIAALRALDIYPHVYHINEGHAAFLSLERLREHLSGGLDFTAALEMVRASTVFTTHTPVPAGHDAFPMGMFEYYMGALLNSLPSVRSSIIELGLDRSKNTFNMTYLALNTAALRNGVSKLHGEVSREMFRQFHGNLYVSEVPIRHVTNGVHMRTWLAQEMKELFDRLIPAWREDQTDAAKFQPITAAPPESIWSVHLGLKERLVDFARRNLQEQRRRNGESQEQIDEVLTYLDPKALTIGFARRFATYKRATLLFSDHDRLDRLVNDPERPVQFIFAGKAHPADYPGQDLIREIYRVSRMERFRGRIVLLENYDINLARYLVQGVDVWLNNPRRPYEASGTSGQKAAVNGVLNFSILDGWWEEGYDGKNGWAITANNRADVEIQDRENTESLYSVLENDIIPLYYNHEDHPDVPAKWVQRMAYSIHTLAPVYNTDRMVQDYTNDFYGKTIVRADRFSRNNYQEAVRIAQHKQFIRNKWPSIKVVEISDPTTIVSFQESIEKQLKKQVSITLDLGEIGREHVAVEGIYWGEKPDGTWVPIIVPFQLDGESGGPTSFKYTGNIPAHLKHDSHYKFRFRPTGPDLAYDFEMAENTTV